MVRRATAVLSGDGSAVPPGKIAHAIIGVAARIGEEVTRRLDRVPEKQADNFYAAMGIGRDPARPARVPVAFKLADPAPGEARRAGRDPADGRRPAICPPSSKSNAVSPSRRARSSR